MIVLSVTVFPCIFSWTKFLGTPCLLHVSIRSLLHYCIWSFSLNYRNLELLTFHFGCSWSFLHTDVIGNFDTIMWVLCSKQQSALCILRKLWCGKTLKRQHPSASQLPSVLITHPVPTVNISNSRSASPLSDRGYMFQCMKGVRFFFQSITGGYLRVVYSSSPSSYSGRN